MHFYHIRNVIRILMRIMQHICVDIDNYSTKNNEVYLVC
jgi:hypothetical protein